MRNFSRNFLSIATAASFATASFVAFGTQASAGEWRRHSGHFGHGSGAAAAAGFVGGALLFNALIHAQRRSDWAHARHRDRSHHVAVGTRGGRFVAVYDRNGNVVGREFIRRPMTAERRAAAQRRAARAAQRIARRAAQAARRAAKDARRRANRIRGHRDGVYASGYNPETRRTRVSFYDPNGNRVTRSIKGRLTQAQIRNVARGN